jgi:phage protein U
MSAIIATLGDLSFVVQENDFNYFDSRSTFNYAQHPKISEKPSLQQVGNKLTRLRFNFHFHRNLSDPEEQISRIRAIAATKEALPLVFGDLYQGNYVITEIAEIPEKVSVTDGNSRTDIVRFQMSLIESATVDLRRTTIQDFASVNPFEFFG